MLHVANRLPRCLASNLVREVACWRRLPYEYLVVAVVLFGGFFSQVTVAQDAESGASNTVKISPRELLILKPGVEKIFGQWVVDIHNPNSVSTLFEFEPHLPRGVTDFQPVDGLDAKNLKLGTDGVLISRAFNPGSTVVSLSFSMPASRHKHDVEILAKRDLTELLMIVPSGFLSLVSEQISFKNVQRSDGENYAVYALDRPLAKGDLLKFNISGIPESRGRLWYVGAIFASILVIGTTILVLRSRNTTNLP